MRKTGNRVIRAIKSGSDSLLRRLSQRTNSKGRQLQSSHEAGEETCNASNNGTPAAINGHERNGQPSLNGQSPISSSKPRVPIHKIRRTWYWRIKILFDFTLALGILIFTAPVILIAMLMTRLSSRGPALYSQTRVGIDGKPFTIYKIRSMTHQCESLTGAQWSKPGDSRITPVGRLLRTTHIDELPQLWNVLRGEMSLIGPRPERPEFVPQLERAIPLYETRLHVRPGVSGLAQVQLPPDTNLESVRTKIAYDIHYIRNLNFLLDFRILMSTGFKLLRIPFPWIRRICCFACGDRIEKEYDQLTATGPRKRDAEEIQTA